MATATTPASTSGLNPRGATDGSASSDRRALRLTAAWAIAGAAVLALPVGALGVRVLLVVVAWHVAVLAVALRHHDRAWLSAYALVAPMSVLLVLPDWFLAVGLETIRFPDTGAPYVGAIPVFMAGTWAIPLAAVVLSARAAERRRGRGAGVAVGTAVGLVVFAVAEATSEVLPLWQALGVAQVADVALYVLPAEALLCATTVLADQRLRGRRPAVVAAAGAFLVQAYAGALALSWLLVEHELA